MNDTRTVSFWRPMKSLSSGGMTRRTACGTTTWRSDWRRDRPERSGGSLLARVDRLDPGAVDLRHVGRVDERQRRDAERADGRCAGPPDPAPGCRSRATKMTSTPGWPGRYRCRPSTGPGSAGRPVRRRPRMIASSRPKTRTRTSAITNNWTLTRKAAMSPGRLASRTCAVEERCLDRRPARRIDDDPAEARRRRRPS